MRIALLTVFALLAITAGAQAQTSPQYPGVSCTLLAARMPVPGSASTDVRMVRLTFASAGASAVHRHAFGEMIYLLSGSGTSVIEGVPTKLTADRAAVIPPNTFHHLVSTGSGPLTVLSVQFPKRGEPAFDPRTPGHDICKPI